MFTLDPLSVESDNAVVGCAYEDESLIKSTLWLEWGEGDNRNQTEHVSSPISLVNVFLRPRTEKCFKEK